MSKSTAWNYINVAEKFAAAPKVVEILPPATVYTSSRQGNAGRSPNRGGGRNQRGCGADEEGR